LHPNVKASDDDVGNLVSKVFKTLGIGILSTINIKTALMNYKREETLWNTELEIIYGECPDVLIFLQMYESLSVSEAMCERLFSFFKR
jgi:hypothetical protein